MNTIESTQPLVYVFSKQLVMQENKHGITLEKRRQVVCMSIVEPNYVNIICSSI